MLVKSCYFPDQELTHVKSSYIEVYNQHNHILCSDSTNKECTYHLFCLIYPLSCMSVVISQLSHRKKTLFIPDLMHVCIFVLVTFLLSICCFRVTICDNIFSLIAFLLNIHIICCYTTSSFLNCPMYSVLSS